MSYEPNVDELMFWDGKPQSLELYVAFAEKLHALCPDADMRVQKTQITFVNPKVFACVLELKARPANQRPKEYITVAFGLGYQVPSTRIDVSTEVRPGR